MTSWAANESAIDRLAEAASVYSGASGELTPQSMRTPSAAVLIWGTGEKGQSTSPEFEYGVGGGKGLSPSPVGSPHLRYDDTYGVPPVLAQPEYALMTPEQIVTSDQYSYKDCKFRCAYCRNMAADQITVAHRMGETHRAALRLLKDAGLRFASAIIAIEREDRFIALHS
jgi:hypothetical protein